MDQPQESTLVDGVRAVPDPRQARGQPWAWTLRGGVIGSARLRNQRPPAALAQGARPHPAGRLAALRPARPPASCVDPPAPLAPGGDRGPGRAARADRPRAPRTHAPSPAASLAGTRPGWHLAPWRRCPRAATGGGAPG
jgi:hypothetical protein